mmetsp:Transcript_28952/g.65413  ORF Transcript_28952/g.65413 Transcript_28952/m.65413 type:complete len:627 (+) Transcript_28952:76-1956(+)
MAEAIEAMLKLGQAAADGAMKDAIMAMYLSKLEEHEAIKMTTDVLVAARTIGKKSVAAVAGSGEGLKLLGDLAPLAKTETASQALAAATKALDAFEKAKDKGGQAAALVASANASIACGEPKAAVKMAKTALDLCRDGGSKEMEASVLTTLISANCAKKDLDEALRAAKELVRISSGKDKAGAICAAAAVLLASGEPGGAKRAAEEAEAAAKDAGDKEGQAIALSMVYQVHRAMFKPKAALTVAKQIMDLVKGTKGEAAAALMIAEAHPAGAGAPDLAKTAVKAFQDAGNKPGEGAATIALAYAYLAQPKADCASGLQAATAAVSIFQAAGEKAGEAVAHSAAAYAATLKEDPAAAQSSAKLALTAFQGLKDGIGEGYANNLMRSTQFAGMVPTEARLYFDFDKIAHVELNEMATQESLEAVVATLNSWSTHHEASIDMRDDRMMKAVVMHLNGCPAPPSMHCYAISSGAFIIGIKSCGLIITSALSGTVSGPTWGLLCGCDYRIATQDTKFVLPVWNPPECLADLFSNQVATYLCMTDGVESAVAMLEMGVLHQAVPDKDFAGKAAFEFAKRLASFPKLALRQTMCLMNPPLEKFALSFNRFDARLTMPGATKFNANYAQTVSAK